MGKINVLDCTLRDGGYVNDWNFGNDAIRFVLKKLAEAKIEYIEVGFLKGDNFNKNRTVFPNSDSMIDVIRPKSPNTVYVGMIDMSNPLPIERISPRSPDGIDAIRVIFKQNRLNEGLEYIEKVKKLGYLAMAQLVSTDTYSDEELIDASKRLNVIGPHAAYIVDSLGIIKTDEFLRMVYLFDHNLSKDIILGYHSHNNLQQAMGNATAFAKLNLRRNILIDACVFGMGRGAGNLNEELFAEYLNEKFDKNYNIEPMLEIIDEYLGDIYKTNFWGYALPFYLTASNKVHPNYGRYYNAKGTLTEKALNGLLKTIRPEDTHVYSASKAEEYYSAFMDKRVDDSGSIKQLSEMISGRTVLVLCPGDSLALNQDLINRTIQERQCLVVSVAFNPVFCSCDFIYCSNMRKFKDIKNSDARKIITSNISCKPDDPSFILNYRDYLVESPLVKDNSGLMALKTMSILGADEILVAGMDGYEKMSQIDANRDIWDSEEFFIQNFNKQMSKEIRDLSSKANLTFLLPSKYTEE